MQDPTDADTGERLLRRAGDARLGHGVAADRRLAHRRAMGLRGPRSDVGGVTLAGYSLLDLLAQWDVARGVQIFGRIENLLDEQYQTVDGYNQAVASAPSSACAGSSE